MPDVREETAALHSSRADSAEQSWQMASGSEMDLCGQNPGCGQHTHVEMGGEWMGTKVEMTVHNGHRVQALLPQGGQEGWVCDVQRACAREVEKDGDLQEQCGVTGLVREDHVGSSKGAQRDRAKGGWQGLEDGALAQGLDWVKNSRGNAEWDGG